MKNLLISLLVLVVLPVLGAPPVLRQFGTTNTPTALTNAIQSIIQTGQNNFSGSNHFTILSAGTFSVDGGGGVGVVELENDGTNIIVLNGTNGNVTATTYTGTLLFTGASTFPSATNTLTLNNDYTSITSATDLDITNILGQVAGQYRWGSLWISNSAGTAITARYTTAGRKIGTSTTNALSIASGKFGMFSVQCFGASNWTNYATAVEQ